jgi:hypothetical protein
MLSEVEVIYTGIVMGVVRVLTCPDHLSALATLVGMNVSSSSSGRRHREGLGNFILGIEWGMGMSLGLSVVCGALFASPVFADNDWYESWSVGVVGVFMIALGSIGLRAAYLNRKGTGDVAPPGESPDEAEGANLKNYGEGYEYGDDAISHDRRDSFIVRMMEGVLIDDSNKSSIRRPSEHSDDGGGCDWGRVEEVCDSPLTGALTAEVDRHRKPQASSATGLSSSFLRYQENMPKLKKVTSFLRLHAPTVADAASSDSPNKSRCYFSCATENPLAVAAGIVHGVAGPGGVLGAVPVVQLGDAKLAVVYLGTFCLTSTCVMGAFALFYGAFVKWLAGGGIRGSDDGRRVFWVEAGSACLSIVVGIVWLVVLSIGKLDEVFYQ